jgi:uncharacterized protein (DUF697 family)
MSTYANPLTEYSPQMEAFEFSSESGGVFSESEEMELAAELLAVNTEQELDHFLGNFIKRAGSALGKFVKSPVGQAIGGALKKVAKTALPIAGSALGGMVGGPVGAMLGGKLASVAGQALGLELEGLSQEDQEFEATKQFIRFAAATVKNALDTPPGVDPAAAAHHAAMEAARVYAPGLMNIGQPPARRQRGRWTRRNDRIILFGV